MLGIGQLVRILWARRAIVLVATLCCMAAAFAAGRALPVRYDAHSRVLMDLLKPDPVSGEGVGKTFAEQYTVSQAGIIRDYRVMGNVVDQLGWTSSPELLAAYNARGGAQEGDFRRWLADQLAGGTRVTLADGSNILDIGYSSNDPEAARVIADLIRDAYIRQSISLKQEAAAETADFYAGQVEVLRRRLAAATATLNAAQRRTGVTVLKDGRDPQADRLTALAGVTPSRPRPELPVPAGSVPAELAQIDARIATLTGVLGPNHPTLAALRQQRAAVAAGAAASARRVPPPSSTSVTGQIRALEAQVLGRRGQVEEVRLLEDQVDVLRRIYLRTAARAAQLRQEAQSDDAGLSLLGSAVAPVEPAFPNPRLIGWGSLGLGLALGVLVALVTELLGRRVRSVRDLEEATGAPIIVLAAPPTPRPRRRWWPRLRWGGKPAPA